MEFTRTQRNLWDNVMGFTSKKNKDTHPSPLPRQPSFPSKDLNNSHHAARSINPQRNINLQNNPISI